MNNSEKIVYNVADYKSKDEMIDAILQQIKIFIENGKLFSFNDNIKVKGTYVLQFSPVSAFETDIWPVWLDTEEIIYVSTYANQKEYAEAKKRVQDYEEDDDDVVVISDGDKKSDA